MRFYEWKLQNVSCFALTAMRKLIIQNAAYSDDCNYEKGRARTALMVLNSVVSQDWDSSRKLRS